MVCPRIAPARGLRSSGATGRVRFGGRARNGLWPRGLRRSRAAASRGRDRVSGERRASLAARAAAIHGLGLRRVGRLHVPPSRPVLTGWPAHPRWLHRLTRRARLLVAGQGARDARGAARAPVHAAFTGCAHSPRARRACVAVTPSGVEPESTISSPRVRVVVERVQIVMVLPPKLRATIEVGLLLGSCEREEGSAAPGNQDKNEGKPVHGTMLGPSRGEGQRRHALRNIMSHSRRWLMVRHSTEHLRQ